MKRKAIILASIIALLFAPAVFAADGLLNGTGSWSDTGPTTLSWEVSWDGLSDYVQYSYTFSVNQHDISHFTLELSDDFTSNNIFNVVVNGSSGSYDIKTLGTDPQDQWTGGDVPHNTMPGDMYGIKFDANKSTTVTITFDSDRMPEWGDFYARCGSRTAHELPKDDENWKQWNSAWNAGFALGETAGAGNDPTMLASSGSYNDHILVPDSVGPTGDAFSYSGSLAVVPEPVSTTLFMIGAGLLGGRQFMRRRK